MERERYGSVNIDFAANSTKPSRLRLKPVVSVPQRRNTPSTASNRGILEQSEYGRRESAHREELGSQAALKMGPLYVITGLNVAEGLKYSNHSTADMKAGTSGNAYVTDEVESEGNLGGSAARRNLLLYTVLSDTILAYRLHIIREVRWAWKRNYEFDTYNTSKASFSDI